MVYVSLCQSVSISFDIRRPVFARASPSRLCMSVIVRVGLCLSVSVCAFIAGARPLDLATSIPLVRARQIAFQNNLGWLAQNMDGAALVDFANPVKPRLVRQFPPDFMQPLFLKILPDQNRLVTADRFRGLMIYDISKSDMPTTVSQLELPAMTTGFDITYTTAGRQMAVLSRAGEGLLAVDISDEKTPRITDRFTSGIDFSRPAVVRDGLVYLPDGDDGGLKVLRLSEPGKFEPLYQMTYPGKCQSVTAAGDFLVAGYGNFGVRLFEFPDNPTATSPTLRLVCTVLRNRNRVKAAEAADGWLFTANNENGIDMLSLQDPALPVLCDEFVPRRDGISVQSVTLRNGWLYASAWNGGVLVFRVSDVPAPAEFNLENLYENRNN